MYVCLGQYMPRVGSRQAICLGLVLGSLCMPRIELIWFILLCYLLCNGDKVGNVLPAGS